MCRSAFKLNPKLRETLFLHKSQGIFISHERKLEPNEWFMQPPMPPPLLLFPMCHALLVGCFIWLTSSGARASTGKSLNILVSNLQITDQQDQKNDIVKSGKVYTGREVSESHFSEKCLFLLSFLPIMDRTQEIMVEFLFSLNLIFGQGKYDTAFCVVKPLKENTFPFYPITE